MPIFFILTEDLKKKKEKKINATPSLFISPRGQLLGIVAFVVVVLVAVAFVVWKVSKKSNPASQSTSSGESVLSV